MTFMTQNFNGLSLKSKLLVGFSLPVIAILLISIFVNINVNALNHANFWVDHTHKVMARGKLLMSSMVDMETGMRGFLVAGDKIYLEPYFKGQELFNDEIVKLRELVSDNPAQVSRLQTIDGMKRKWIEEAAEPQINIRKEIVKGEQAEAEFKRVSARLVGKQKFDAFRSVVADLDATMKQNRDSYGQFLVLNLLNDMINQETGQRGFLLSGKEESLEPYKQGRIDFVKRLELFEQHLATVTYSVVNIKQQLVTAKQFADEWSTEAALPEIEARRKMNEVTMTMADITAFIEKGLGKKYMDAIRGEIADFVNAEEKLIVSRSADAESTAKNTITILFFSAVIGIILAIIAAIYIVKDVMKLVGLEPSILASISRKIADGDLTQSYSNIGNETGVYAAMLDMSRNLKSLIKNVADSSRVQQTSSQRLLTVAEQTSKNVALQNSSTDQIATAMEELRATAAEVASNSSFAADSASEAHKLVNHGNKDVASVTKDIHQLAESLRDTNLMITDLSNSAENIASILDVIKKIADQTNLLALNAAIEAARAGELGRGFAVVADEVRSLAQNTQNSTTEIESMIKQVQQSASVSQKSMNNGLSKVEQIVGQTESVTEVFNNILTSVLKITDISTQIATAAEEQAYTTDDISKRIVEIRELSNQTANDSIEMNESAEQMVKLSNNLNNELNRFSL
ncbi:CHASE3 domain-containing protein [Shewanella aestuarii]|uniref:Methyl-accepting transducer domain-containing protein n=1 Tax=Shewanella aestuarii TaxID=1028752 RepID=A0A6G9QM06_9GAMM|nr:CHASE3 domain-containing protein [Shewanella aestuarii]QIR15077.1 hypothetical protein HBH39_11770 [Shewanella aestuarii]